MSSFYLPARDPFVLPSQWSCLHDLEVELWSRVQTMVLLNIFSDVGLANIERLSISANDSVRFNLPMMPNLRTLLISDMVWFHRTLKYLPWNQLTHLSSTRYKMHTADWLASFLSAHCFRKILVQILESLSCTYFH